MVECRHVGVLLGNRTIIAQSLRDPNGVLVRRYVCSIKSRIVKMIGLYNARTFNAVNIFEYTVKLPIPAPRIPCTPIPYHFASTREARYGGGVTVLRYSFVMLARWHGNIVCDINSILNSRIMINNSTLDYHVTNFKLSLTRSLDGSDGQIKTLTLYSDPYPNPNQTLSLTIIQTVTITRNLTYFLIWPFHVMSRDWDPTGTEFCTGTGTGTETTSEIRYQALSPVSGPVPGSVTDTGSVTGTGTDTSLCNWYWNGCQSLEMESK